MGNLPALVAVPDERLVLLYGFRDPPFGLSAVVSRDRGRTWSEPAVLRDDGDDADLGYPCALVRQDGKIIVVYYFNDRDGPGALHRSFYPRFTSLKLSHNPFEHPSDWHA